MWLAAVLLLAAVLREIGGRVPDSVLSDWLKMPPGSPPNIRSLAELEEFKKTHLIVSNHMYGGFGNELFRMATCQAVARRRRITVCAGACHCGFPTRYWAE